MFETSAAATPTGTTSPLRQSKLDQLISGFDGVLRAAFGVHPGRRRPSPAAGLSEPSLSASQQKHAAGLMRVNHTGEVCAQALYVGQALVARDEGVRDLLLTSAREEADHLAWCEERLHALSSRPSLLDPAWFAGSLAIGLTAALAGDRWSLGFLAETERQVVRHLDSHLASLPDEDQPSRSVVAQMREDEEHHATSAVRSGGRELPGAVRKLMELEARVMTTLAYHI
ncbi:MAG: 2-polyprenyl-3-methyl-6-methoxy-1,4-benzoquinone monooxygenase [Gammaproteobacteria bacterium]|nr:2-polyprenyl-3-methyl-6-methoxy-1,4-benzoquinone monooxygenase [Gammaproteobacteria bacterium]